jgi:DNA gyrase/topoisomerase IV subunit B
VNEKPIYMVGERENIIVEIALQWNDSYTETTFSFANNINTTEGGTHMSGFRSALTRTINAYAANNSLADKLNDSVSGDDIREGMTAIISVKIPQPQFEGQTKTKLGNTEVKGIVEGIVNDRLGAFLEENPPSRRRSSRRRSTRRLRVKRRARPATLCGARVRSTTQHCQANWRTVRSAIPAQAKSTSSKVSRPAARPNRAAIVASRRSCRSRARSSTSKRPVSTRC